MKKKISLRHVERTTWYKVKELAKKVKVSPRAIYYKLFDADLKRLEIDGIIYINGNDFIEYELKKRKARKIGPMPPDKMYCLVCDEFVKPIKSEVTLDDFTKSNKKVRRGTLLLKGTCSNCGRTVCRMSNVSKLEQLKENFKFKTN